MPDEDIIISMADFRRVFCVQGTESRFKDSGLDFEKFVREGLPVSMLMGRGYDGLIKRVLKVKRQAELMAVSVPPANNTGE